MRLYQIQQDVERRSGEIDAQHGDWPCRAGCDACCRSLASEPQISEAEWRVLQPAIDALGEDVVKKIRSTAGAVRPVVCALLDEASGTCRVYDARPVACRAYGFYAERREVLGCAQIERVAAETPDVIWGNHAALLEQLGELGPARPLSAWVAEFQSTE